MLRPWMTTRWMSLPITKGRGPAPQVTETPLAFRLLVSMLRSQIAQMVLKMPPDIPISDLKK
ncbi:hypothetical protein EB233_25960 [Mesorhizobium erdmanii]|uniref:Uncharacterized protein n=1 Tax=Mesorhizobium erdmanii TaxID=1777866 RepID=A0A6M7UR27_9HYPH|nr:hypothetical protein A8146_01610 [Mesorhizobium loti]QKC78513.1 hypothetical protein EB233_25960 [Mesorhizobium erdmanii]